MDGTGALQVADWRRRVSELYADVRRERLLDPVGAHRRWCDGRNDLFATHPQTPLTPQAVERFAGLRVADYDPSFAWHADVDTSVEPVSLPVGTSGGATIRFVRVGRVVLPPGPLDVYWLDAYGGGMFVPFRDATSGRETYGGGRYLLDTAKGADLGAIDDGELVCDFNFAYHPSCHYAPAWNCPLAPPDNWLSEPIPVGELAFPG